MDPTFSQLKLGLVYDYFWYLFRSVAFMFSVMPSSSRTELVDSYSLQEEKDSFVNVMLDLDAYQTRESWRFSAKLLQGIAFLIFW